MKALKVARQYSVGPPLSLFAAVICFGIILISLCNAAAFISTQSCIPGFCSDDGSVRPLSKAFSCTSRRIQTRLWDTFAQLEPGESWHCRLGKCPWNHRRKNKNVLMNDLVIQYIQVHHLISPSLCNEINMDSDNMTFSHCSKNQLRPLPTPKTVV